MRRNYIVVMAICGAFAGLAGVLDVLGWQFRIATNDIRISDIGVPRHRGRAARAQHGDRRVRRALLFGALITGTSVRNLDPTIFEPALAANLTLVIQGLVVLLVSTDVLVVYLWRLRRRAPRLAQGGRRMTPEAGRLGRRRARRARVLRRRAADHGALAGRRRRDRTGGDGRGLVRATRAASGGSGGARSRARVRDRGRLSPRRCRARPTSSALVVWGALLAATLRYATPLLFGALGGLFSERSGVINIALEGMMLIGAFFGAWGADVTGSWFLGIVIAIVAGAVFAAASTPLFAVSLRADQIVSGTALNLLALGITGYLYVDIYGTEGTPDDLPQVPDVNLPIESVPLFGDVFGAAQPARLGRAGDGPADVGDRLPDAARACGCARRARTRWRPRPRACR